MRQLRYYFLFLISYGVGGVFLPIDLANAAEVDSFTDRRVLQDSRTVLNAKVNDWLAKAVDESNRRSRHMAAAKYHRIRSVTGMSRLTGVDYCNQDHLYRSMRKYFARPLIGQLESYVNQSPNLDTIKTKFEDSIYQNFALEEAPSIASTGKMAVLVRIDDVYLGADKFGHFFTEGWTYFSSASESEKFDIDAALAFGELSESVFFGSITTGVYSHADLVANFNGMRFWVRLLGKEFDPLYPNQEVVPYVTCENKQWKISNTFDWNEYVDVAWDEAVNCSQFRSRPLLEKVLSKIKNNNKKLYCPLVNYDNNLYEPLNEKYGDYLGHLFNGVGHKVLAERLQAPNLLAKYLDLPEFKQLPKWQQRVLKRAKQQIENWLQNYQSSALKAS